MEDELRFLYRTFSILWSIQSKVQMLILWSIMREVRAYGAMVGARENELDRANGFEFSGAAKEEHTLKERE